LIDKKKTLCWSHHDIMILTRCGFGVSSFLLQNVLTQNVSTFSSKNLSSKQNVKKETINLDINCTFFGHMCDFVGFNNLGPI
jgi:hypothetical protein